MVSPSILTHPFKPFDEIVKSQVIQESDSEFVVKVVAGSDFSPDREAQLVRSLQERLGSGVNIAVLRVSDIPPEPSGKFRWVISKVPHQLNVSWGA